MSRPAGRSSPGGRPYSGERAAAPASDRESLEEDIGWVIGPEVDVGRPEPGDTARYISQMASELTALAAAAGLETLGYLLAMARVEADLAARDFED